MEAVPVPMAVKWINKLSYISHNKILLSYKMKQTTDIYYLDELCPAKQA